MSLPEKRPTLVTDLPNAILGEVYSHLEDAHARRSFFHASKVFHNCDAILDQICKAGVGFESKGQGSYEDELINSWPRLAILRTLTVNTAVKGRKPQDMFAAALKRPDLKICKLLSTVTEVRLVGPGLGNDDDILQKKEALALGASLCACPKLQKLELLGGIEDNLLKAVAEECNLRQKLPELQELRFSTGQYFSFNTERPDILLKEGSACVRYISMLSNLKILRLHLEDYHIRALRRLTKLETLELGYQDVYEHVSGLEDVLLGCTSLQELRLYKLPPMRLLRCPSLKSIVIFYLDITELPKILANQKDLPNLEHVRLIYGIKLPDDMKDIEDYQKLAAKLACCRDHINNKLSGSFGGGELTELGPVGNYNRYYKYKPRNDTEFGFFGNLEKCRDLIEIALEPIQPFFARSMGPAVRLGIKDIYPGSVPNIVALMPNIKSLNTCPGSNLNYNTLIQLVERLPKLRTLKISLGYNADKEMCMMACETAYKAGRSLYVVLMLARPEGIAPGAGDMDDLADSGKEQEGRKSSSSSSSSSSSGFGTNILLNFDSRVRAVWRNAVEMCLEWRVRAKMLPGCRVRVGFEFLTREHHDAVHVPGANAVH